MSHLFHKLHSSTTLKSGLVLMVAAVIAVSGAPFVAKAAVVAPTPAPCGTELLVNGGFETPVITKAQGWDAFPSGENGIGWSAQWIDQTPADGKPDVANLEFQTGHSAQAGSVQYTELDSDWDGIGSVPPDPASVRIYQTLTTVPGATYTVSFYTSPLPGKGVTDNVDQFSWDGSLVDTIIEDGTGNANTVWTQHIYSVTATGTSTTIQFADGGVSDSFGTLLDSVSAKQDCPNGGGGGNGLSISGKVYADANNNNTFDGSDTGLNGWTVTADDTDSETAPLTTQSGANGDYAFNDIAAGCYTVTETLENGFTQTEPNNETHAYYVAVGGASCNDAVIVDTNAFTALMQVFVNTAQAANPVYSTTSTGLNFGNLPTGGSGCSGNCGGSGGSGGSGGGSGGGTPVVPSDPNGQVLGDSTNTPSQDTTPVQPQVLGATTQLPRTGIPASLLLSLALSAFLGAIARRPIIQLLNKAEIK